MPASGKSPRGRPTVYSAAVASEICERIADGESLRAICRDEGMPPENTVRRWAIEDREGFSAQYARAREAQAESLADEILEIADDATNDWNEGNDGARVFDHEHVNRARLRVDSRKWLLSKLLPKKYGDSLDLKHSGNLVVNVNRFPGEPR
jgi:hypothetical protein